MKIRQSFSIPFLIQQDKYANTGNQFKEKMPEYHRIRVEFVIVTVLVLVIHAYLAKCSAFSQVCFPLITQNSFFVCREHDWFKDGLPEYLFPPDSEMDASVVDTEVVAEVCEVTVFEKGIVRTRHLTLPKLEFPP